MIPTIDTSRIGEWVIRLLVGISVLTLLFALIPPIALPTEVSTSVEWLVQTLVNFDFIVPIDTLFSILSLALFIEFVFMTIRLILWLNHHFNRSS